MLPSVSIGLPTFNRAEMVIHAAESVIAQTYEGVVECVIIDDGSTDETPSVLRAFREVAWRPNRPIIIERHRDNRGIAFAKNRALLSGTGEMRGILDSDDAYLPRFVERSVAELIEHPEISMSYADNWLIDAETGSQSVSPAAEWSIEALLRCQLRGDTWLARWSVLERTQLHDLRFPLECDYDLMYQLARLGPFRRIPEPLVNVTQHAGRTTRDRTAAAYWHAAGLAKWGYPITWAELRATGHPEWLPAIAEGYQFGKGLRGVAA